MPFDLEVHFEFLCAFVPPKPFDQDPDECWVVLPDFTGLKAPDKPHYPCVLYHRDHRVADLVLEQAGLLPRPTSTKFPPPYGANRRLIVCDGEEIEIRPNGKTPAVNALKATLPHLLRIQKANLSLEKFDQDLVNNTAPADVAARIRLLEGELSEAKVTTNSFGLKNTSTGHVVHQQRMARRISLRLDAVDFVDLVFRKLSPAPQPERVLRLQTASKLSTVTVRNCEDTFIWKTNLPAYNQQLDSEINLYFRLSANYDPTKPPPRMVLTMIPTPAGPLGICAPKAFDGMT